MKTYKWNIEKEDWLYGTIDWTNTTQSRSEIGKKAFKTFLKNGGSRNAKGQFSKPIKVSYTETSWYVLGQDIYHTYKIIPDQLGTSECAKAFAKVFQKHGLISKEIEI